MDIQNQVCDCLARLTNLETLRIGYVEIVSEQFDSLDPSVANGLDKLAGLRSLTYFGVANLKTKLGVQWMTKHWLGLHQLHSADDSIADEATVARYAPSLHQGRRSVAVAVATSWFRIVG